jgi:MFS family permease
MIPREHGAYAELLFPMAAVFLGGMPSASAWLLATAAVAFFLANEPILILFGQRGARAQREQRGRARRALLLFMLVAIGTGIPGLWLAPQLAQYAVGLPLLLGVGVMMMAVQGLERTVIGETMAAATLSSTAVPLGLASGLSVPASFAVAAIWLVASLLGTSAVRLTVARTRAKTDEELRSVRSKRAMLILVCLAAIGVGIAAPLAPRGPLWILTAALPVAVVVTVVAMARPTARSLRSIGWGLVLANVGSLVAVVSALKLVQDFQAVKSTLPFPMF